MKIFLIRHGETDWNAQLRYQGHTDIRLNERGKEQARKIADHLVDKNVTAIYSSDLCRAWETAEIIAEKLKLNVIGRDPRLKELNFGSWEGKTFEEIHLNKREEFNKWFNDTMDYTIPGGESLSQLADRASEAIKEISARHLGKVVLVTHGGVIRAILYKWQIIRYNELWDSRIAPGFIALLDIDRKKHQILSI